MPTTDHPARIQFLDRLGWPVERIKGRPIATALRLLLHTRKIAWRWAPTKRMPNPNVMEGPAHD